MRISYWSSDVCSSYLLYARAAHLRGRAMGANLARRIETLEGSTHNKPGRTFIAIGPEGFDPEATLADHGAVLETGDVFVDVFHWNEPRTRVLSWQGDWETLVELLEGENLTAGTYSLGRLTE